MNISVLGLLLGLLLLALPLYVIYHFKLRVMHRFLMSMVRMVIGVVLMSLIVYGAICLNSIVYDIVALIVLSLLSTLFALKKARLRVGKLIIPAGIGGIVAVAFISFYVLLLVFGEKKPFIPHLFMPVVGLISGSMVAIDAKALQTYYSGLLYHNQLYNYLLGNGATHREAVRYFVKRCLEASIVAASKQMSCLVFVSAPVLLLAMIMCGANLFTAAAFQVLFYIVVLAASLISLCLTLLIGRKYSFDEYERLKNVYGSEEKAVATDE